MESFVVILCGFIIAGFLLKISFYPLYLRIAAGIVCLVFVPLAGSWAVEQSSVQVGTFLAAPARMQDLAVGTTLESIVYILFCFFEKKRTRGWKKAVRFFIYLYPGFLFFAVLAYIFFRVILVFPGTDFVRLAWATGAAAALVVTAASRGLKKILPETDLRKELLFVISLFTVFSSVAATVNGQPYYKGVAAWDWRITAGVLASFTGVLLSGFLWKILNKK